MEYTKEEIGAYGDGLDFKNFFCRGSSRKEKIDTNHKLLIFLHHGDNLFLASKFNFDVELNTNKIMKIKLVSKIHSDKLYFLTNEKFFFLENITDD